MEKKEAYEPRGEEGRSEVKAPTSPSCEIGDSSGLEEEDDGWGR